MQPGTAPGRATVRLPPSGNGGCAGITVTMPKVRGASRRPRGGAPRLARLRQRPRTSPRQAADRADLSFSAAVDQLNRDRAALASLDDAYADGLLDQPRYRRQVARITARISEREAKVAAMVTTGPTLGFDGQGALIRHAWGAMTLEERRTVVGVVAEHFIIEPAGQDRGASGSRSTLGPSGGTEGSNARRRSNGCPTRGLCPALAASTRVSRFLG